MSDFKKLLAEAQLPKRIVSICLRGDLVAEIQHLEDELAEAQERRAANRRLADKDASADIAAKIEAKRAEMKANSIEFELTGFPSPKWRAMKAAHPIGENPSNMDRVLGTDSVPFLNEAVRAAITSPAIDDEDWAALMDKIVDGEWDNLVQNVYEQNEVGVSIPTSARALRETRAQSSVSN